MVRFWSLVVDALTLGSVYAFIALGFHLIYRAARMIDFAQGNKAVLGGLFALTLIEGHVAPIAALFIVGVFGLVMGLVYDKVVIAPTQRNGTIAVVSATVGASLVIANVSYMIWGSTGQPLQPLTAGQVSLGGVPFSFQSFWIWGSLVAVVAALMYGLRRTRFGRGMVAASSDPFAATSIGVNVSTARTVTFALAFGLAAVGGMLVAPVTLAGGAIGATLTLKGFTGAVLGGLDNPVGVVVGSLILGLIENLIGGYGPNGIANPLDFAVLLLALLVVPRGIFAGARLREA
jgi:branched-chain amino acid transport system permease protein